MRRGSPAPAAAGSPTARRAGRDHPALGRADRRAATVEPQSSATRLAEGLDEGVTCIGREYGVAARASQPDASGVPICGASIIVARSPFLQFTRALDAPGFRHTPLSRDAGSFFPRDDVLRRRTGRRTKASAVDRTNRPSSIGCSSRPSATTRSSRWTQAATCSRGTRAPRTSRATTASEIIGRHFSVFYPAEDVQAGKPAMELVGATRDGRFEDEGWRLRKDGTRFWANVVITALRDDQRRSGGIREGHARPHRAPRRGDAGGPPRRRVGRA